ncbi:MAG: folate-binding protein YgfZ [Amphiplicatus sp.]
MTDAALLSSRAVLRIAGPDARPFLSNVVTQDVAGLAPGAAAFSALLTPQGKILADFVVLGETDGFLLDVAAAHVDSLVKRLGLYRLRAKATIEPLDGWAVGAVWNGEAGPAPESVRRFADPRLPALGARLIGLKAALGAALGPEARDEAAYDRHRLKLGVPEFGRDFGPEEMFLLDVGYDALNGVSYKKGCFIGQEVSSRMKRKGEVRKRTLQVFFDGPPPAKGAPVTGGGSAVGAMLSAAEGAGLALMRLDRLDAARAAGESLSVEGRPVEIRFPDWLRQG